MNITIMKYFIVDAFSEVPFGGNPAAVVLLNDVEFPDDKFMQQVAAEFRYSETAFVKQNDSSDFTVRYFTPAGEVDLCGHATIATFGVLRHEGIVSDKMLCINHTLAGDLKVGVGEQIMMQMAPAKVVDVTFDTELLHVIMGAGTVRNYLPIEIVSTGLPDIMMPLANIEILHSLRPNMDALAKLSKELGVTGVHAFVIGKDNYIAHARNFAPLYGIDEESATGTANAALTHYLHRHGIISCPSECRILQGEAMGRPSVVVTDIVSNGDIWVGGTISIVATGELLAGI